MKFLRIVYVFAVLLATHAVMGQRLSPHVIPTHYDLEFVPNLEAKTFTGTETVSVHIDQATSEISLNAVALNVTSASIEFSGSTTPATVTSDHDRQQIFLHVDRSIPAGQAFLHLTFNGILTKDQRGFYLGETDGNRYAITQFEPTDARRDFPSFDEPAMKASFTIRTVVDESLQAISNMPIATDTPSGNGKHTVTFTTSPRMSTYTLALIVGKFNCIGDISDGVKIRVCSPATWSNRAQFALSAAVHYLHFYNAYFGVKYPLPKLDLIALQQLKPAAMENFGAITFREHFLLTNEFASSEDEKQMIATIIAHEMSHQWLGDLVTIKWWNDAWLNEGLATWMENKAARNFHPAWYSEQSRGFQHAKLLSSDTGKITNPREEEVQTPTQIEKMFNANTYSKAGAVLSMVENYVGEASFQQGIQSYLRNNLYGNTTSDDFLSAQTATHHKPVEAIFKSYLNQEGFPLITVRDLNNGKLTLSQTRFRARKKDVNHGDAEQLWSVPVCFHSPHGQTCHLLNSRTETIALPENTLSYANSNGEGYYRTLYTGDSYNRLLRTLPTALSPTERATLVADQWSLLFAGQVSVTDYLSLLEAEKDDPNSTVMANAFTRLIVINEQLVEGSEMQQRFAKWISTQAYPRYVQLKQSNNPDDTSALRMLHLLLGTVAHQPELIVEANQTVANALTHPETAKQANLGSAFAIACEHGDSALYDRLKEASKTTTDPELKDQIMAGLAKFRDPSLVEKTLNYAISDDVTGKQSQRLLLTLLNAKETNDQSWKFISTHWEKVVSQDKYLGFTTIIGAAHGCSAARKEELTGFMQTHSVLGKEVLQQRVDRIIGDCLDFKAEQQSEFTKWLAGTTQ